MSERLGLGYPLSALMFTAGIAIVYIAYRFTLIGEVLAFWVAYILTRPLGASMGDLLTQPKDAGGKGLGTIPVSVVFLLVIVVLVIHHPLDGGIAEDRRCPASEVLLFIGIPVLLASG